MIPLRTLLAAYAALSAAYLLYLPDALPVLDDWAYLGLWDQARAGGLHGIAAYLTGLLDNTYNGNLGRDSLGAFEADRRIDSAGPRRRGKGY